MRVFRTALLGSLALGACFSEPGHPATHGDDDAGMSDDDSGVADSGPDGPHPLSECGGSTVFQSTLDAMGCDAFGATEYGGGTASNINGHLKIAMTADTGDTGCREGTKFELDAPGVFVEVAVPVAEPMLHKFTWLITQDGIRMDVNNNQLVFEDAGSLFAMETYDPVAMRWWRMRPDRTDNRVIAEYSADGRAWTLLGKSDHFVPSTYLINFRVQGRNGQAARPFVELDNLNICPP